MESLYSGIRIQFSGVFLKIIFSTSQAAGNPDSTDGESEIFQVSLSKFVGANPFKTAL